MLLKNKHVAILGAGPVGLTMAKLLQQKGIQVTVYERDKDAQTRVSGGTLDLHPGSGQEAMKKAGLLNRYFALAIPMGRTVADEKARVLYSKHPTPEDQYDNPEINRNDLRKMLLDSLADNTVVWDSKFTSLEVQDGKWVLHFENGMHATADLVIGANGGMSAARKYVTDAAIEYSGTLIFQGDVLQPEQACSEFFQLCDGTILMAANKGDLLVANPRNGQLLSYSVILKKPEKWRHENEFDPQHPDFLKDFLLNRFSHWHDCYKELFRSTSSFVLWKTRKIPLDIPWKKHRPLPITLIGDAAHIMPPFAGKGVNTGLMDASVLSENLTKGKFENLEAAISNYEAQMMVYATKAQQETSKNELQMLQPDFSFLRFYQ